MQTYLLFRCNQLIKDTKDKSQLKKLELIKQMLETENCFLHLDASVALNILATLGLTEKEAQKTYLQLSGFKTFKEGNL